MENVAKRRKIIQFVVRLCSDVFLDVLDWGNRRQLAELEKLGRRFLLFIDRWFEEAPFLRLNLLIETWYFIVYSIDSDLMRVG